MDTAKTASIVAQSADAPTKNGSAVGEPDPAVQSNEDSIQDLDGIAEESTEKNTHKHAEDEGQDGQEHHHDQHLHGYRLFALLGFLTLAAFLTLLDASIIGVALPRITSEFHSLGQIGWYTSAYQLASAALQPLSGKLYTHFKAKWIYLIFFLIFELGSLICATAQSSTMLIVGRAVAGMGGSGLLNGGLTIMAGAVPLEKRPAAMGIYLGIAQAAIVCGPLIGGGLTEKVTWRWCFYINLPPGAVVVVLLLFLSIPELTKKAPFTLQLLRKTIPELDLIGFSLFTPAAIMFLLALQFGGAVYPWNSSTVIGLFVGAGVTFILFIFWERRMDDRAMMPRSLLGRRIVWCSAINGSAIVAEVLVAAQYLPVYFQGVKGFQPALNGVATLPSILSQIIAVIVCGVLVGKVGYYLPFAVAGSALSGVGNLLTATFSPFTYIGRWIGYQILMGSGRGLTMQTGIIAVQHLLQPTQVPVGMAFLIFCQNFSGAIFSTVANLIFSHVLLRKVKTLAPSVSPQAVLAAGAGPSAVRALASAHHSNELRGVLRSYTDSINDVFDLLAAVALAGFLAAWGMGWINTKKIKEKKESGETTCEKPDQEV